MQAKIIYNKKITGRYFHLVLKAQAIARIAQPGQFVNIKVNKGLEPLLRRPFSIHKAGNQNIEFIYEVVGEGSGILSRRKVGEWADIIGPLGNGFSNETQKAKAGVSILAAGGMGVAPLLFLAEQFKSQKVIVLIGARTKNQILCAAEFKKLGCEVRIATDDGSRGFKGKVTDLLKHLLSTINYELLTIYACGPRPMSKEISRISKKYNIPAQISLEEHMACGIGACLGCAVKTRKGFRRVCKDGPVFNAEEIIW